MKRLFLLRKPRKEFSRFSLARLIIKPRTYDERPYVRTLTTIVHVGTSIACIWCTGIDQAYGGF